jgi:hypothetical protein
MSHHGFGVAVCLGALCTGIACASTEDLDDQPVRPAQFGGSSGTGATGDTGGTGGTGVSGGSSATGGAGGSAGIGGSGAASGGSGGTAGTGTGGTAGASTGGVAGSGGAAGVGGSGSGGTAGTTGGSGGATGEVLFFDDFEGAADKWVSVPSDGWAIVADGSNVYKQGTLDTAFRVSSAGDASWTDQVVEAKVKVLAFQGSSSSYLAGVYARFQDFDNHYYVSFDSYGAVKIRKKSGGNNTSLTSEAPTDVVLGTWYTVKLEVIGSTLKAYVDGVPVLVATDTDIAAGGIAVGTKNATAEFDDVRVTKP